MLLQVRVKYDKAVEFIKTRITARHSNKTIIMGTSGTIGTFVSIFLLSIISLLILGPTVIVLASESENNASDDAKISQEEEGPSVGRHTTKKNQMRY